MNRTLNSKFVGGCKTYFTFKNCILEIIEFYSKKINNYQERNVSITRSLAHYVKNNLIIDLIEHDSLKKIKADYKEFLKSNRYPINENEYDSDSISNYEKKIPSHIELTSSESSNEEENIKNIINDKGENSSDDDSNNDEIYKNNNKNKYKKNKIKKDNNNNNKKASKSKRNEKNSKFNENNQDNLNDNIFDIETKKKINLFFNVNDYDYSAKIQNFYLFKRSLNSNQKVLFNEDIINTKLMMRKAFITQKIMNLRINDQ